MSEDRMPSRGLPSRGLMVLAVVTAVSVVGAAVATYQRADATAAAGALLVPGLMERINDIAVIRVERGAQTMNLVLEDGRWTLAEKSGYPARFEVVKTALVALGRLKTIEAKTAKAALYPKLWLGDPGSAEAKSTRLTMLDDAGASLGAIIVGKTRAGAAGRAGVYVRRPDEARAWLADGDPKLPADAIDWLDRKLIDLARERIASARLEAPDGATVEVTRADAGQRDFTLAGVPEGQKIKSAGSVNAVAWTLERLRFDDVTSADRVDFATAAAGTATFTGFDGLTVQVTLAAKDDATWARLEASADDDAKPEAHDEAAAIRARTQGWAFRLPELKLEKLRTRLADLIEAKPE